MFKNPHALAIIAAAERILPLTRLHPGDQRASAIDIIGDFYKIADDIDAAATRNTALLTVARDNLTEGPAASESLTRAVMLKAADQIDDTLQNLDAARAEVEAHTDTLAKLGAAVALAQLELQSAYQRTSSLSERHRLAPLIASLRDAMAAYRADPVTPKAPGKAA